MSPEKRRKWLFLGVKLGILAILVWCMRASLMTALEHLSKHQSWHVKPGWLVLSAVLYLIAMLPQGVFSQRLLVGSGHPVSLAEALRAYYLSQLGKYVPGKAMVLILRAALLRRSGVTATLVTAAVFVETLTTMASGSLVALLCLAVWYPDRKTSILAALVMLAATALPILPPVFKLVVRVLHVTKLNLETVHKLAHVGRGVLITAWLTIGASWFIQGLSLWATLVALDATDTNPLVNWPLYTAAVALSVVAGFLALIPGGLGVRELVLIPLLAPVASIGEDNAVISAIILRLVGMAAEVVISGILYVLPTSSPANAVASSAEVDGSA